MNEDTVLEDIWFFMSEDIVFGFTLYNDENPDKPTELYLRAADGTCWRIRAERHEHHES